MPVVRHLSRGSMPVVFPEGNAGSRLLATFEATSLSSSRAFVGGDFLRGLGLIRPL
jgi:hypothetical protein